MARRCTTPYEASDKASPWSAARSDPTPAYGALPLRPGHARPFHCDARSVDRRPRSVLARSATFAARIRAGGASLRELCSELPMHMRYVQFPAAAVGCVTLLLFPCSLTADEASTSDEPDLDEIEEIIITGTRLPISA